tara:strand:+ start:225 stop:377 length:153 start_codon:yes stop_codon:yes gene_type:complete
VAVSAQGDADPMAKFALVYALMHELSISIQEVTGHPTLSTVVNKLNQVVV